MTTTSAALRRWRAAISGAAAIVGLAALAGCAANRPLPTMAFEYPNDPRQRHPISIREGERRVELFIGSTRGRLTPTQHDDIVAFAHAWRREAAGGIIIDVPAGTSNERAAVDAVQEIRALLAASGVPPAVVDARPYRPASPNRLATIRLNYPRMVAEAGPCGTWPRDLGPTIDAQWTENQPYWNFGCAPQRNLAAMVDDPGDLVQPRGDVPVYTARRNTVFEKYRKGESTATVYPDANKGKISDLGQ
jgi:pilus assembly protein CpaD